MLSQRAFFSFTEVPNPADHRAYNEWHQLDHRPENLRLPGVLWGERFVRSPDCAQAPGVADGLLSDLHYLNMYWFADPVEQSTAEWTVLGERSFQWGRRGDVHIANRLLMGFFRPVKGYVNARVLVNEDVLPFRPARGIHATLTRVAEPGSPRSERRFEWYDRERIPQILACSGAAGAWVFASETAPMPGRPPEMSAPDLRILLVYLDGDPLEFTEELARPQAAPEPSGVETTLFSGPLRAITPWQWDWFDVSSQT